MEPVTKIFNHILEHEFEGKELGGFTFHVKDVNLQYEVSNNEYKRLKSGEGYVYKIVR